MEITLIFKFLIHVNRRALKLQLMDQCKVRYTQIMIYE